MMRQSLPQVETLEMPADPSLFARTLRETGLFTRAYLTEEDKNRGQIYAAQRKRDQFQQSCATLEDFLKSLEMVVSIHPAGKDDIKRVAQLTQRTNQFNLTTRRYTEADIAAMCTEPELANLRPRIKRQIRRQWNSRAGPGGNQNKAMAHRYVLDELPCDWQTGRRCPGGPNMPGCC